MHWNGSNVFHGSVDFQDDLCCVCLPTTTCSLIREVFDRGLKKIARCETTSTHPRAPHVAILERHGERAKLEERGSCTHGIAHLRRLPLTSPCLQYYREGATCPGFHLLGVRYSGIMCASCHICCVALPKLVANHRVGWHSGAVKGRCC